MQYECTECGQMNRFVDLEQTRFRFECPSCGAETVWEPAFDGEGGMSF